MSDMTTRHNTTTDDQAMPPCPGWCREHHDHREVMFGEADHLGAQLSEFPGPMVALWRTDRERQTGQDEVIILTGTDGWVSIEEARKIADAISRAVEIADGC